MEPAEILEALRLALVSGAITIQPHYGPYPASEVTVNAYDDVLSLTWCGANVQFMPRGSSHESLVRRNVSECTYA